MILARPKSYQREAVLEQAMACFWHKGYDSTSISDLTEATGLNRKTLYGEFGDKALLFQAALERYLARVQAAGQQLAAPPLGLANIERFFEQVLAQADCRGCLATLSFNEWQSLPAEAQALLKKRYGQLQGALERNLLAAGVDLAREKAALLISQLHGMATLARQGLDREQLAPQVTLLLRAL
ncbi:TetR/AcrR family transcriptional regulator [Gallaecimonas sp. GXIMD4217]|uniref:TetR/AcrR family transcriptional regulator n=1 Tax=Gallaecimonas sp. GXIMD4217 TaxID=3131927 RepID=UPI00311ABC69